MGYRSNVNIYIVEREDLTIKQILRMATIEDGDNEPQYKIGKNSQGESVIHIKYTNVKWYMEYPIVRFWKNLFDNMNEERFLYAIQGESFEDIDIMGNYGYAYPVSYIEYNVDFEEQ